MGDKDARANHAETRMKYDINRRQVQAMREWYRTERQLGDIEVGSQMGNK